MVTANYESNSRIGYRDVQIRMFQFYDDFEVLLGGLRINCQKNTLLDEVVSEYEIVLSESVGNTRRKKLWKLKPLESDQNRGLSRRYRESWQVAHVIVNR